jgi:exo-beta-1,3-glucanase (GH17 family)
MNAAPTTSGHRLCSTAATASVLPVWSAHLSAPCTRQVHDSGQTASTIGRRAVAVGPVPQVGIVPSLTASDASTDSHGQGVVRSIDDVREGGVVSFHVAAGSQQEANVKLGRQWPTTFN